MGERPSSPLQSDLARQIAELAYLALNGNSLGLLAVYLHLAENSGLDPAEVYEQARQRRIARTRRPGTSDEPVPEWESMLRHLQDLPMGGKPVGESAPPWSVLAFPRPSFGSQVASGTPAAPSPPASGTEASPS